MQGSADKAPDGARPLRYVAQASPPASSSGVSPRPNPKLVSGLHFRGVLPHIKKEGGTYFVTFRQAGTLPREVLLRLKAEREAVTAQAMAANRPLAWHEQESLFRWYSERVDRYLDAGHGQCHLQRPDCAELVSNALRFFDGQRYELRAWVVMPNHVHAIVQPKPPHTLSEVLHSWKSFTAHQINKLLPLKVVPFWQSESYDHLIRDDDDLHRCSHYTLMNPVNAGLCAGPELWRWSSAYSGGETPPKPAGADACAT